MIRAITASGESFKPVEFSEGFNVVLAERTDEATERDSRNGSGKTSLVEILHFCLGAKLASTLAEPALEGWTFSTRIDLGGTTATISRNTARPNRVRIDPVEPAWHIQERLDEETGERYFTVDDWKEALSEIYFDLPRELLEETYTPSQELCFRISLAAVAMRLATPSPSFAASRAGVAKLPPLSCLVSTGRSFATPISSS